MEHVTFDEFFDFVKNEDADWYIPGLKEYFEGLNQDERLTSAISSFATISSRLPFSGIVS